MFSQDWSRASLGDHRVLAEPVSGCIGILNPLAAWVLKAREAGLCADEIAAHLATQFGLDRDVARADVDRAIAQQGDLLKRAQNPQPRQTKPAPGTSRAIPFRPRFHLRLRIGLRALDLELQSDRLHAALAPVIEHLGPIEKHADGLVQLRGDQEYWQFVVDGEVQADGSGLDDAVCRTISELADIGCDIPGRQLVLHSAGVSADGRGVLLIGAGGSGKSTLVAALNASGFDLINDDVIAVSNGGRLTSACLSLCLKPGSWPVLAPSIPLINRLNTFQRQGQGVKYLPPSGGMPELPVATSLFLFPVFDAGQPSRMERLEPWEVLQGVVDAESFIPDLDQARLEFLVDWVSSSPAYRVRYPDIESGLLSVTGLIREGAGS